jgi:Flp pilus assembly pilin Flp
MCSLIFYAVGIATNLFANPIFSMFFIISDQTAHNIAYAVLVGAATVAVIGLTVTLFKKRKTTFPEINNKPAIVEIEPSNISFVRAVASSNSQATTYEAEKNKTQEKNQDKIGCPSCEKKFSTPSYVIDNSSSPPKLIMQCPHCKQNIYPKTKNNEEDDSFGKYVDELHKKLGNKPDHS